MSMNAARRFLPSLSSSAVLCRAVRAGQLSKRKKMIKIVAPIISATTASAIGHATRYGLADFDIGRSGSTVFIQTQSSRDRSGASGKRRTFGAKKLPPPTSDRREGRLFPPEQS